MNNSNDSISRWETPHLLDLPIHEEVYEQTLDELRSEAVAQGYAEGFAQGARDAELAIQQQQQNLDVLLHALTAPYADLNQQVLDTIVLLSGKIARALVKRELHTAPDTIMALVRDTIAILNMPTSIVNVHLHPEDARLLNELTGHSDNTRWLVIEDPMIARGDCKVSCHDSIVDGNLASRINAVITQFQGDERG
ncbi:MAG: FliH/SctL family protein [Pseudomonadota bacterium]